MELSGRAVGLGRGSPVDLPSRAGVHPRVSGVYRFRDEHRRVVYVGKAKNLRARLSSYFQDITNLHPRTATMVTTAASVEWTVVNTEVEALQLEYSWIKEYDPRFNVKYRDDKSYPWLAVTLNEEFPRVMVGRGAKKKGVRYFGPYSHAWAIRETVDLLLRVFPMRSCSNGVFKRSAQIGRPCLLGYIDKCAAPCVGKVSAEEHREIVQDFCDFMSGQTTNFVKRLEKQMYAASAEMDFEKAARLRDDIGALNRAMEKQQVVLGDGTDADVVAFAEDPLEVAVQIFYVRGGRIRGQRAGSPTRPRTSTPASWSSGSCSSCTTGSSPTPSRARCSCPRCPTTPPPSSSGSPACVAPGSPCGAAARRQEGAPGDRRPQRLPGARAAQDQARQRPHHPQPGARGDPGRARAARRPAPHRVLRHLQPPGHRGRRVDGGLRGRPGPQGEYRRFIVKGVEGQNDVASMHEVITRRFRRLLDDRAEEPELGGPDAADGPDGPMLIDPETGRPKKFAYVPGLVVVDGGPPQVAAAQRALDELGIDDVPVCGLAKRLEEVWLPGQEDPVILPRSSEGLYLLQRIRDEAHRFAITHHRSRRSKSMVESVLDDVPGLGRRRKTLLNTFGSLKKLRAATMDDIAAVPGIGPLHRGGDRDRARGAEEAAHDGEREHRDRRDRGVLMSPAHEKQRGELVVVTGMTGAGRSTAAKELEDLGFFVVDNLPPQLVPDVVRLVDESQGNLQPVAVVVDVRSGSFFASLQEVLAQGRTGRRTTLLFLEANDDVLVRRQEAARRPHPLQEGGRLLDGLQRERAAIASLRGDADVVIDTSNLNVHQLTDKVAEAFGTEHTMSLKTTVVSFVQVRHPGRRRPRRRHALPAQPVLGARAAAPVRARQRGGGVRQGASRGQGVRRAVRRAHRDRRRGVPARGQAVHDRRDRLHRRQAPQRRDDRGDRRAAERPRPRRTPDAP